MPCFYSLLHRPATPQIYTLSLHDALPIYFDPLDEEAVEEQADAEGKAAAHGDRERRERAAVRLRDLDNGKDEAQRAHGKDRKSTRLNSSHANISYAVFCLKKKNAQNHRYQ